MRAIVLLLSFFLLTLVEASQKKVLADAAVRRKSLADRAKYWGTATWFVPSQVGNQKSVGACWEYESDSEYIVAMVSITMVTSCYVCKCIKWLTHFRIANN